MQKPVFLSPIMGDILLPGVDGEARGDRLVARVRVSAPAGRDIWINSLPAIWDGEAYAASVPLDGLRNRIEAVDTDTGAAETITVFYMPKLERAYRFTVDDCTRCFEDINAHADTYQSIFENPFLRIFKDAYDQYGSHVHINVFYESYDGAFNLSMMTDKFKDEFIANAHWLSITFHAAREYPCAPYRDASYVQVLRDCVQCTREIERFAGREVLRNTTTLHFGASNVYGSRALRAFGFKALCGYILLDGQGNPYVANHLTQEQVAHATGREGWVDVEEDIMFFKLDMVLNAPELTADRVAPFLDELKKNPHEGRFIQMVIHEQYFYEDYFNYEPDFAERIMNMARWMHEHGYKSVCLSDVIEERWY